MLKQAFFIILFCSTLQHGIGQSSKKDVILSIVSFYDTIISEPTALVNLRLTNTSDTTIKLSNHSSYPYGFILYLNKEYNDTINTKPNYAEMHYDPIGSEVEIFTTLRPGESREFQCSLFGDLSEKSIFKIKFHLPLSDLNKDFNDPETVWIKQYFNIDYEEYRKKLKDEYEEYLKKKSSD